MPNPLPFLFPFRAHYTAPQQIVWIFKKIYQIIIQNTVFYFTPYNLLIQAITKNFTFSIVQPENFIIIQKHRNIYPFSWWIHTITSWYCGSCIKILFTIAKKQNLGYNVIAWLKDLSKKADWNNFSQHLQTWRILWKE